MIKFVLSIAAAWLFVNFIKILVAWKKEGKLSHEAMFSNGGMPSGHTALVASLVSALYMETGFSPYFITGVILAILVVYDALRVRNIIEKQAAAINELMKDKEEFEKIDEKVGHTPAEVIIGTALGVIIPVIIYTVF
jgi:acid phosphatase family membrane protein YuiD